MPRNFEPASQAVATSIPYLRLSVSVAKVRSDPNDPNSPLKKDYQGDFHFEILDQNGSPMDVRSGDLIPHLTEAQKTSLIGFLDTVLTKAEGTLA